MKLLKVRRLSLLLAVMLFAAAAFNLTGCKGKNEPGNTTPSAMETREGCELGKGSKSFRFDVVDKDGKTTTFTVKSDAKTVGQALLDVGLIAGDNGQYGLYVKTVNGITADYETDGTYWAFYIDGQYGMSGVDTTDITDGTTYSFKVEK